MKKNKVVVVHKRDSRLVVVGLILFIIGFVGGYYLMHLQDKETVEPPVESTPVESKPLDLISQYAREVEYMLDILAPQFGEIITTDKVTEADLSSNAKLFMLFKAYEFDHEVVICSVEDTQIPRSELESLLFSNHDFLNSYNGTSNQFVWHYRYGLQDNIVYLQNGTCDFSPSTPISVLYPKKIEVEGNNVIVEATHIYMRFSSFKEFEYYQEPLYNTYRAINETKIVEHDVSPAETEDDLYDTYIITFEHDTMRFISVEKAT